MLSKILKNAVNVNIKPVALKKQLKIPFSLFSKQDRQFDLLQSPSYRAKFLNKINRAEFKALFGSKSQAPTALINEGYSVKIVGNWLLLTAGMVIFMICVGGYTRLTKSGLSMTKWKPIGYKFPRTAEDWEYEYSEYKKYPEYQLATEEITLNVFKRIFFVEYFHRVMGNAIGFVFGIPLVYFLGRGYFTRNMKMRMVGLLGFGGLQGLVGWWMVKSGLKEKPDYQSRPRVSTYRLLVHNSCAVTIYSILLYHGLILSRGPIKLLSSLQFANVLGAKRAAILLIHLVALNLVSGVTVAGIDAGKVFNTWPLMNGAVVPDHIWRSDLGWRNFFENYATVQFNHRNLAYLTYIASLIIFLKFRRSILPKQVKNGINAVFFSVNSQVALGIWMLLEQVPVDKGVLHQFNGMILLSTVIYLLSASSRRFILL